MKVECLFSNENLADTHDRIWFSTVKIFSVKTGTDSYRKNTNCSIFYNIGIWQPLLLLSDRAQISGSSDYHCIGIGLLLKAIDIEQSFNV